MWGAALANLAKKARKQADRMELNEVTNTLSGAFGAFNLDSMLDNGQEEGVCTTHAIPVAATNSDNPTTNNSSYNNDQNLS
jgi:hypothetical protein